ncbi:MAG: glycosyltransferase, partial [Vicinamibacterales bacterium]
MRHQLALVHTSSSWRLTAPLRASGRLLSRLFAGNRRTPRSPTTGIPAVVGPLASSVSDKVSTATPPVADRQLAVDDFDRSFYLQAYPDIAASGVDPHQHYLNQGRKEGRLGRAPQLAVDDFDRSFYLQAYPDIAASGVDPHQHYLNQGRKEGRLGRAPQLIANAGPQVLSRNRPTILVVSHEASRTGAPILAWNICRELRNRCNVIVMLLGGGGIASYFAEDCDVVIGPYRPQEQTAAVMRHIVNELCDRYDIDVALVNSIESRAMIQPLAERCVPSVLLIHEFFIYVWPREEFVAAMRDAAAVVFSARIVQRNALTERTRPMVDASYVLAQGKCLIPSGAQTGLAAPAELAAIEAFVRRGGRKRFFVLGAGTVEYRKGVDLFVATAAEVRRQGTDANVAMLWIGRGFDPERDMSYSAYVQQQIVGGGIDNVAVVGEVENLEAVYALADVLFLSSRLDPMPNVAIDAMSLGKPVICFDTATGIAEILAHNTCTAECIVPFANVGEAATLILRMQSSPAFADAVSVGVRDLVAKHFDMPSYVARLFDIAWAARTHSLQERSDAATLQDAADFDVGFASTPVTYPRTREQAIVGFLRSSASGIDARRPAPGFDAATYAREHELGRDAANPFAHWLRAGRPDGPWRVEVIDPSNHTEAAVAIRLRRALHVHAFYIDLLDDIVARLGSEGPPCDLFVSVASDADAAQARRLFETYRRGACDVRLVPN